MTPAHWSLLSRVAAAVVGGYALATTVPVALVAFCSVPRVDAVLMAMQLSFLVYAAAVMWAFAARSACHAWAGLGVPVLLAGAVAGVLL